MGAPSAPTTLFSIVFYSKFHIMKQKSFLYETDEMRLAPVDLPIMQIEKSMQANGDIKTHQRSLSSSEIIERGSTISPFADDLSGRFVSPPTFISRLDEVDALRHQIDSLPTDLPTLKTKETDEK